MKPLIATLSLALLLALVIPEAAEADRQTRRDKRRQPETEEAQPEATAAPEAEKAAATPSSLGLMVYPAGDQNAEQQANDEGECSKWAQEQVAAQETTESQPAAEAGSEGSEGRQRRSGGAVRGAAKGAAKGAVIEEIADHDEPDFVDEIEDARGDDDPSLAEVGAVAGGVRGRRQQKQAEAQAAQQAQQAQAQAQAEAAEASAENEGLKKAMTVCLEARGYKVG